MQYLFKKDEMLKLINDAPDSDTVVISVTFRHGDAKGIFIGEIKATTTKVGAAKNATAESDPSIDGCPNPPGC